jgi:NAD(P)-dependent dehydrogenase (short-subunit alcohol dehydrogenase family)
LSEFTPWEDGLRIDLAGKVLLVTGSTQGLGARIAELAAEAGAEAITICGRQQQAGEAMAAKLVDAGTSAHYIQADLGSAIAPSDLVERTIDAFGRVDLLVNAAAVTDRASLIDGTLADWEHIFDVNVRAPFFLMQAVVKDMLKRGAPGSIVNILSTNIHCGTPDLAIYSASKGALATLTKNVANAHMRDRIRVNGINMGWVATPNEHRMQGETLGKGPDWADEVSRGMPLKRMLTIDEVARLTLYLLSDLSGLQTGTLTDLEQAVLGAPNIGRDS